MSNIRVPTGLYFQSRFFAATAGLWRRLGDLETRLVREETEHQVIDRPVYVASLPRSGTTIVTEMLAQHPDLTCHHYSDFPNIWTPYWRNYLLKKSRLQTPQKVERAHGDRIEVSNDSPEAAEEVLWRYFFPGLSDADSSHVLDPQSRNIQHQNIQCRNRQSRNARFDRFYQQHIQKLLTIRNTNPNLGNRYLTKGNYNISRFRYILELFPDAKFLVPVRDPVHQIASLMRQHERFILASQEDPRIPKQMAMAGHFEFGPGRIPVNFNDSEANQSIADCWQQGHEVAGWARYWAATYQHILGQLEEFPEVRNACLLFRYEDLCAHSAGSIDNILQHCELPADGFEAIRTDYIDRLSPPDYYPIDFDPDQLNQISHFCDPVNESLSKFCQNP